MSYFKKILAFSIGSDFELLEKCPQSERNRHYTKGFFILITSIISSLLISYAIVSISTDLIIVFLSGFIWFLINFSITKLLLITLKSENLINSTTGRIKNSFSIKRLFTIISYFVFTLLISIIISYPIIFKVLENEIQQGIVNLSISEIQTVNNLKKEEINLIKKQEIILENSIEEQKEHLNCWRKLLVSERSGIKMSLPCGATSGLSGYSIRSQEIEKILVAMKEEIDSSSSSLIRQRTINNYKIKLLELKYNEIINETKYNYSNSFLKKSSALQNISNKEPQVAYFKYLVVLIFILLNMAPFLLILTDTKTGVYEQLYYKKVENIFQNNYKTHSNDYEE